MAWEIDIVKPANAANDAQAFQSLGDTREVWERIAVAFPAMISVGRERHWQADGCLFRASAFLDRERAVEGAVNAIALTVSGLGDPHAGLRKLCEAFGAEAYDVYENGPVDLSRPALPGWDRYRARATPQLRAVREDQPSA